MLYFREKKVLEVMQYKFSQKQNELTALIEEYAPLVKRAAQHIKWKIPDSIALDDLIQSGVIGLIEAHNSFSLAHHTSFKTYATLKIRYAIYEALRQHTGITRELSQSIKQVANALDSLQKENKQPTALQISGKLGISTHEYACVNEEINLLRAKSLEATVESEYAQETENNPFLNTMHAETKKILNQVIFSLEAREQILLALYYNELLSFKEIGRILDLTEARVSQIHSQLLAKLKAHLTKNYNLLSEQN